MGNTAFEGDSQIEYGIKRKIISHSSSEIPKSSNQLHKKIKVDKLTKAEINNPNYCGISAVDFNSNSEDLLNHSISQQLHQPYIDNIIEVQSEVQIDKPKEQPVVKDTPRSRKSNEALLSQIKLMNNETLDVLRSIQNNLSSIAADMRRIADAQENRNIV